MLTETSLQISHCSSVKKFIDESAAIMSSILGTHKNYVRDKTVYFYESMHTLKMGQEISSYS
jgi:hypothetical protein